MSRKHHPPSSILDFHIHEDICHPRKSRTSDFRGMHTLVYMLKASMPGNREHPISGVDRHWSMCPRHQLPEIENTRFPGYADIGLYAQGINARKSRTPDFRGGQTLVYVPKASIAGNREHPISGVDRHWYICSRHQCRKSRTSDFRGIQKVFNVLEASMPEIENIRYPGYTEIGICAQGINAGNREHPISGVYRHCSNCSRHQFPEIENSRFPGRVSIPLTDIIL